MKARIVRQMVVGATGLIVSGDLTYQVASHSTPAFVTTAVLGALLSSTISLVFSGFVTGVRERTVACPRGCGFSVTMPASMVGTYQPVIDDHQCAAAVGSAAAS